MKETWWLDARAMIGQDYETTGTKGLTEGKGKGVLKWGWIYQDVC